MLHTSFRTRARIRHLVSQGRGYVTSTDSLGLRDEISARDKDPRTLGQHNPS